MRFDGNERARHELSDMIQKDLSITGSHAMHRGWSTAVPGGVDDELVARDG